MDRVGQHYFLGVRDTSAADPIQLINNGEPVQLAQYEFVLVPSVRDVSRLVWVEISLNGRRVADCIIHRPGEENSTQAVFPFRVFGRRIEVNAAFYFLAPLADHVGPAVLSSQTGERFSRYQKPMKSIMSVLLGPP